jgi:hypothetical protein
MARANHVELLVEEPSAEAFFQTLLPRLLPQDCSFAVHAFQGKDDLLIKLEPRLRAYASWLPADWRLFVMVDRDDDDCRALKRRLERIARHAGVRTRSSGAASWQLVNRIVVEELEAWYFGDWEAVHAAYPRVSTTVPRRRGLRDPDAVAGGTWEAFERVMQAHGYFEEGLQKIAVARALGTCMDAERNRSTSFRTFHAALREALA